MWVFRSSVCLQQCGGGGHLLLSGPGGFTPPPDTEWTVRTCKDCVVVSESEQNTGSTFGTELYKMARWFIDNQCSVEQYLMWRKDVWGENNPQPFFLQIDTNLDNRNNKGLFECLPGTVLLWHHQKTNIFFLLFSLLKQGFGGVTQTKAAVLFESLSGWIDADGAASFVKLCFW